MTALPVQDAAHATIGSTIPVMRSWLGLHLYLSIGLGILLVGSMFRI